MIWQDIADETREYDKKHSRKALTYADVPAIIDACRINLQNVQVKDDCILAYCPFHRGDPTHRKLFVNLSKYHDKVGVWRCLVCGDAAQPFFALSERLGFDFGCDAMVATQAWLPKLNTVSYQPPTNLRDLPADYKWVRNDCTISRFALDLIGAKIYESDVGGHREERLWLPVEMCGTTVGHIGALVSERYDGCRKYMNSKGLDAKGIYVWIDQTRKLGKTVILVEGPADALHLIDNKIAAMPILGLHNWTRDKAKYIDAAFDNVVVMMDNDAAGQNAKEAIRATFVGDLKPSFIKLPTGCKDAAEMSASAIAKLKRIIKKIEK